MATDFDRLKKDFIVDQEEHTKEKLASLMALLLPLCKVTKDGQVVITEKIPTRKVLKLILSARFIAHVAQDSISAEVSKEELKAYSAMRENVLNTRLNELLRENFAEKKENAIKAKNILLIEQFLRGLKENGQEKK